MRTSSALVCVGLSLALNAYPQGRPVDWPFYGGDAQRNGWEKVDSRITKDNVKEFRLVIKRKLENGSGGPRSLTPPVVIGNLISYKGFKELAFVAGSSGNLWSIDVDTDRVFWTKQLGSSKPDTCAGVTAVPSLTPPLNFAARPRPAATRSPGVPPTPAGAPAPARTGILGSGGFGAPRPAFALSSDGKLHLLNTSTGDDLVPAIPFIPANAKASSLVIADGAIYTTTSSDCGAPAGVWALNLTEVDPKDAASIPKAASFKTNGGSISTMGGAAIGTDGTVYVQTGDGPLDAAAGKWSRTLLALEPKTLKLKQHFTVPPGKESKNPANAVTPTVFTHGGHDMIVTAGSDGSLYLLDSQAMTAPVYKTPPLTSSGSGIWGGISTWQDADGTRWVLAPVWGALNPELKLAANNAHGSIVAFKIGDQSGKAILTPAWVSRDISSPEPPVITSGIVFALSAGDYAAGRAKGSGHATLYALDALTGQEIYNTGNQASAPANLTGITVANGRVYFTTSDNTLYAFGIYLER